MCKFGAHRTTSTTPTAKVLDSRGDMRAMAKIGIRTETRKNTVLKSAWRKLVDFRARRHPSLNPKKHRTEIQALRDVF